MDLVLGFVDLGFDFFCLVALGISHFRVWWL